MVIRINVKKKLLILVFFAVLGTATVAGKVIYVDGGASGANNGSSWTQL